MIAARLHDGDRSLRLEEVPTPEPEGEEILVDVVGAGVCRSDLHILDGEIDEHVRKPVTMGHEIAGHVSRVGSPVRGLEVGTPVVVMVGWGCGNCEWCLTSHEQLCPGGTQAGATADGGFAECVLVPHSRIARCAFNRIKRGSRGSQNGQSPRAGRRNTGLERLTPVYTREKILRFYRIPPMPRRVTPDNLARLETVAL